MSTLTAVVDPLTASVERAVEAHHGVDAYPLPESLTGRPKRDLGDIEAHHAKDAYALPESMIDVLKRADDLAPHHGRDAYPLPDSVLGFVTI